MNNNEENEPANPPAQHEEDRDSVSAAAREMRRQQQEEDELHAWDMFILFALGMNIQESGEFCDLGYREPGDLEDLTLEEIERMTIRATVRVRMRAYIEWRDINVDPDMGDEAQYVQVTCRELRQLNQ